MVFAGLGPETDFFDFDFRLRLAGFTFLLGAFIKELAEVHDPANRRDRPWGDFNQVEFSFTGHPQSLIDRDDTDILVFGADDANFRDPDELIDPIIGCAYIVLLLDKYWLNGQVSIPNPSLLTQTVRKWIDDTTYLPKSSTN